ncbi:MAG TPA: PepSY-associated TM helix domain-containing protein [Methylococcus sp.]|nr:PepSY-associated TM helix domain-containing protein [Methylococcus sp.]
MRDGGEPLGGGKQTPLRQRSRKRRLRRMWLAIHASLTVPLGFLFVVMGITGSLNVFAPTFERWFHPELTVTNGSGVQRSPDELLATARSAHPGRFGAWTLQLPQSPEDVALAWNDGDTENRRGDSALLLVAIDPYTAEVRVSRYWGETAATWIYDLHSRLLLGESGRYAIGLLGLSLLASVLAGLRLWLPSRHRIRQAFTLNTHAGFKRKVFDLHRVFGIYSAAILIVAALSGFHLVFPDILEAVLDAEGVDHHRGQSGREIQSSAQPSGDPLNLAQAILMARGLFPSAKVHSITVPSSSRGTYRVDFLRPGEDRALTSVWIDRYSGQIRHVENSADFDRRQRFLNALPSLHSGRLFGLPGRCIWFLAGLAPLGLYATGWVHRLNKRRRRIPTLRMSLPEPCSRLWHQHIPKVRILWLRTARRIAPGLQRLADSLRNRTPRR